MKVCDKPGKVKVSDKPGKEAADNKKKAGKPER